MIGDIQILLYVMYIYTYVFIYDNYFIERDVYELKHALIIVKQLHSFTIETLC